MEISGMNVSVAGNYGTTYTAGQSNANGSQCVSETTAETTGGLTDKQLRAQQFWMEVSQTYAEQTAATMSKITDGMQVAQEIFRRMASGAKVSQSDEQTLMNYDAKLYMAAKNAQMMAQRKEDLSNDSLTEQFEERHANDRKDWASQLEDRIVELGLGPDASVTTGSSSSDTTQTTIDVSV